MNECKEHVESLRLNFIAQMDIVKATVSSKVAVPTAQVYPQFISLAHLWNAFQDEMVLISVLTNILSSLDQFSHVGEIRLHFRFLLSFPFLDKMNHVFITKSNCNCELVNRLIILLHLAAQISLNPFVSHVKFFFFLLLALNRRALRFTVIVPTNNPDQQNELIYFSLFRLMHFYSPRRSLHLTLQTSIS